VCVLGGDRYGTVHGMNSFPDWVAGLIRDRFQVTVHTDYGFVSWIDGPDVTTVETFLAGHGIGTVIATANSRSICTPATDLYRGSGWGITRDLSVTTTALTLLRGGYPDHNGAIHAGTDLPPGGLQPEPGTETTAVAAIAARIPDGHATPFLMVGYVLDAIIDLGGAGELLHPLDDTTRR
jgi:hypothetical protein